MACGGGVGVVDGVDSASEGLGVGFERNQEKRSTILPVFCLRVLFFSGSYWSSNRSYLHGLLPLGV